MKFVCDRCQTKYSIADERVRGKVLKVKCKTCANLITVREPRRASSAGLPTLSAAGHSKSAAHPPIDTSVETEERTQLAQSPFAPEADPFPDLGALAPAPAARRPTGQVPPIGAVDDHVQWYLALDGNRTGPFNRQKLVDRLIPLAKNADVHIWNERLDGWKPPSGVPEIAGEISRRRAVPPPPPLPGAPRRPTPPPIPPIGGLPPHGQPRRPTGPVPPVGHGIAAKLPPPGGVHPALAARGAHETGADPSSLLETPAPLPHGLPHSPKTNGVGASGAHATHPPPKPATSDIMQTLNLPGSGPQVAGAPPQLMSLSSTIALGGTFEAPGTRSRSATIILALIAVIAVVVGLFVFNLKKTKSAPAVVAPPPPAPVVEPPPPPPPPPPVIEPTQPEPPAVTAKGKLRGGKPARPAGKQPPAVTPTTSASDAARFRDNSTRPNVPVATGGGGAARGQPAQADITKVISNNRGGIKVCYQRALTRDNSLTHGKLAVNVSIGISGRVKRVNLDGPTQFRTLLEPCIKDVVQRWVFPQSSEEYETQFPLVFQGNE